MRRRRRRRRRGEGTREEVALEAAREILRSNIREHSRCDFPSSASFRHQARGRRDSIVGGFLISGPGNRGLGVRVSLSTCRKQVYPGGPPGATASITSRARGETHDDTMSASFVVAGTSPTAALARLAGGSARPGLCEGRSGWTTATTCSSSARASVAGPAAGPGPTSRSRSRAARGGRRVVRAWRAPPPPVMPETDLTLPPGRRARWAWETGWWR